MRNQREWSVKFVAAASAVGMVTVVAVALSSTPTGAQEGPVVNPPVAESCGTDVTLVLDASGSIGTADAVDTVRDAAGAFLDALADTGSRARVTQFASLTEELAAFSEVTRASLDAGGYFDRALRRYYDPKPPRPGDVQIYSYRGGGRDPQLASSWNLSNGSNQYTNWASSLAQAGDQPTELVVYVTDGDPTAYDFDEPADPFDQGPPPDVGVSTDRSPADAVTLARATAAADDLKGGGARVLAVGVGGALSSTASRARLQAISGPQVVRDADLATIESINDVDVALVTDFDDLADFLRRVVNELCAPSMSIRKLAQSADSAEYVSTPGWDITAAPTVTGGTFEWTLPDTDVVARPLCGDPVNPNDGAPRTCETDGSGLANFQWEPDPSDASTAVSINEALQAGFLPGRPGPDNDWNCRVLDPDDGESQVAGELDASNGFDLTAGPEQIITCAIYNSFVYAPSISLTKVNEPTIVRGDLPATDRQVRSTYTVTNPGNTPLAGVVVSDDEGPDRGCTPVEFIAGDTDGDGLLDPNESWTFECVTPVGGPPGTYVNTADVVGVAPNQQQVTDDDDDDVEIVKPDIELVKVVAGGGQGPADMITVPDGTDVTYTFTATNTGDSALADVVVTDPNCGTPIVPTSVPSLPAGDSVVFTCDLADVVGDVVNVATVSGTPVIPGYAGRNPDVTDVDTAEVTTFSAEIRLTKSVDQPIIFPGTEVTYTFSVTLPDDDGDPIVPTDPAGAPVARDNWVIDPLCDAAPTYQSGDIGDDSVLEFGEIWVYTCERIILTAAVNLGEIGAVVNVAEVFGVPATAPDPANVVGDDAVAVVRLVVPLVDVTKSRSRDTVLDPPTTCPPATVPCGPITGPDAPTPRTVDYLFEVRNPGVIRLDLTDGATLPPDPNDARITDTVDGDPGCAPAYVAGDVDGDGYLDPIETWVFECLEVALDKSQAINGFDVENVVEVTGTGILPGPTPVRGPDVTGTDDVRVQVITPNFSLTKTPSATLVRPGTEVTYTYELAHTGDPVGLDVIGVADDLCSPVVFVSGDNTPPAGNGLLQAGEVWTYECTQVITSPDDPGTTAVENEVTNTAVAAAIGPLGNLYVRDAAATVRVFDPAIELVKTVSQALVPVGTEVTYTFTVTNTGDDVTLDELTDIVLTDVADPAQPTCASPTIVDQGDGDDVLAVGELWTFECAAVIDVDTVNTATVTGVDIGGGSVSDDADAFVAVYEAGIDIVKTAEPTVLPIGGGEVTYSYEVTNTGNVPLADVASRVVDDTCSPVTYVSGDDDGNDLLTSATDLFETGPAEVWLFTCVGTVTQDTLNTVVVDGTPVRPGVEGPEVLGPDVTADATAFVEVPDTPATTVPPSIAPPPVTPAPPTTSRPVIPPTGGGGAAARWAVVLMLGGALLIGGARRREPTREHRRP